MLAEADPPEVPPLPDLGLGGYESSDDDVDENAKGSKGFTLKASVESSGKFWEDNEAEEVNKLAEMPNSKSTTSEKKD